eukprot:9493010-Pyramimonas_sp.AAC.1
MGLAQKWRSELARRSACAKPDLDACGAVFLVRVIDDVISHLSHILPGSGVHEVRRARRDVVETENLQPDTENP